MYTFTHLCLNCIPVEVAQMIKTLPALQEAQFQSLGWEDSLVKGMATHSQYSCLENSTDRGDWQAIVHGVAESDMIEQLTLTKLLYIFKTFFAEKYLRFIHVDSCNMLEAHSIYHSCYSLLLL